MNMQLGDAPAFPRVIDAKMDDRCLINSTYKLKRDKSLGRYLKAMAIGNLIDVQTGGGPVVRREILDLRTKRQGRFIIVSIVYDL